MKDVQVRHWWYVGRRKVLSAIIRSIGLGEGARVLDAGCGSGGNLALLSNVGNLEAFEFNDQARAAANALGLIEVRPGWLPFGIPTQYGKFDLITLFDVLEHIDNDRDTLVELGNRLATNGRILVTVPAVPWLWSTHDEIHHHKRRYTRSSLEAVVRTSGLSVHSLGYFNSLLFPLAVAQRIKEKLINRQEVNLAPPPEPINSALKAIFSLESGLIDKVRFPIGLSLFAVLGKDAQL